VIKKAQFFAPNSAISKNGVFLCNFIIKFLFKINRFTYLCHIRMILKYLWLIAIPDLALALKHFDLT
jgi:hypothetical protein